MRPGALPEPLTGLIGRESELDAIGRLLAPRNGADRTRLLTLVGPGGVGKTRLAIEAARRLCPLFSDGARFVPLSPVASAERVPHAIAQALGLPAGTNRPLDEQLLDLLVDRRLLLVLDNFDHVLAAAPLIGDLLAAVPGLSALVTSRERLHLAGEQQYPVPPLAVPNRAPLRPVAALAQIPSVALFMQRACAVAPDFALTPVIASDVADVVCRLDGLPLAIELAAVRVNVLPVHEISARLDHSLRLLTVGTRGSEARHESMRASLDWSYGSLTPPEQALLARLAVFRGNFSLAAAEALGEDIAAGDVETLDLLARLVAHSLVIAMPTESGEARFSLLEVIRQYALERLRASGEETDARDRHLAFYQGRTANVSSHSHDSDLLDEWVGLEYDNLLGARDWAQAAPERAEAGLRLFTALQYSWWGRWPAGEVVHWTDYALASLDCPPGDCEIAPEVRAGVLASATEAVWRLSDFERACALAEEALTLYDTEGGASLAQQAELQMVMGLCSGRLNDRSKALRCLAEALTLWRAVNKPRGAAVALLGMAEIRAQAGDFKSALLLLQESTQEAKRDACRELAAHILKCRVIIEAGRGETAEATRLCSKTLPMYARAGDQMHLAGMLHALSGLLTDSGGDAFAGDPSDPRQIRQAAVLEGAAEALLHETGYGWPAPFPQPLKPLSAAEMCASLGEAAYAAALAEGQAMTIDEAVAYAECIVRSVTADAAIEASRQAAIERYSGLTAREREVATLIAQGCSNANIADELVLSERTVEAHVRNILNKLGFDSRSQIAAWAVRVGLDS